MKKILLIEKSDVCNRRILHGPINSPQDYLFCVDDKKDANEADIIVVENITGSFTVIKAPMQSGISHMCLEELGEFLLTKTDTEWSELEALEARAMK